jgi:hypothetical protein
MRERSAEAPVPCEPLDPAHQSVAAGDHPKRAGLFPPVEFAGTRRDHLCGRERHPAISIEAALHSSRLGQPHFDGAGQWHYAEAHGKVANSGG